MSKRSYDVWCPSCGCQMKKRQGKFGEFYGCTAYPTCKNTLNKRDAAIQAILDGDDTRYDAGKDNFDD